LTRRRQVSDTGEVVGGWSLIMDEIKFFGGESPDESEDLPWGKDWVKSAQNEDLEIAHEVISCYIGDKGILVETGMFKTFIFKKEKVCKFLQEALLAWVNNEMVTKPLIVAYVNRKFCYGINESKPDVIWVQSDNRFASMRLRDDPSNNLPRITTNPFLPSPTTPPTPPTADSNGKRSQKQRTPQEATQPPK
jgi:hypothetical protein